MTDPKKAILNPLTLLSPTTGLQVEGTKAVKEMTAAPDAPKAKAAPTPDEEKARIARERLAQRKYAKAGRAGTMLTDDSKLG